MFACKNTNSLECCVRSYTSLRIPQEYIVGRFVDLFCQEEECVDGKGHACPVPDCNVVCSKAYKLKLHMLSHSGERPFKVYQTVNILLRISFLLGLLKLYVLVEVIILHRTNR